MIVAEGSNFVLSSDTIYMHVILYIFDIAEFYSSITEKLLDSVASYAQTLIFPNDIIQLTKQARKSLFFTEGNIWMKKGDNALFGVTMGSYGGL